MKLNRVKSEKERYQMFFSGSEVPQWFLHLKTCGVTNFLFSYYYADTKGYSQAERVLMNAPKGSKFMCDSGAYTIRKLVEKDIQWYVDYIERYVAFLRKYKDYIFSAVELDVESIVGVDVVNKWRKKYFVPLEKETGIKIIYVWHDDFGMSGWEEMCRKYKYVGLSNDGYSYGEWNRFFNVAKKYGTRIHGFAITFKRTLKKFSFYTSDSVSWLIGKRFGEYYMHKCSRDWRMDFRWKHQIGKYSVYLKREAGFNYNKFLQQDSLEVNRISIWSMLQLEKSINKHWGHKAYWAVE